MNEFETPQQEKINPFFTIWLHPKKTTRYVIQEKSWLYVIILLSIGYIGSLFTGYMDIGIYPNFPLWAMILITIILSPIVGLISNAISAFCTWLIGKMFSGKGTYAQLFKASSLSVWPFIVLIPIYLLWMLIDPNSLMNMSEDFGAFAIIGVLFTFIATIWSIVITIAAIAEAHQFSNWKAFFTLLIFAIIIAIIFILIGVIIGIIIVLLGLSYYM
ncbi:Yip1 family protein [Ureibacillus thermosphaericus]|uniref:Yip1 domain-containing protein n=1 Tax=Ureibacillus thermosphaericus TaxID=51173 RepID=A0A840PNY8_URETH|nr:Yip1 family protein [Ureibacillus thermosphaericus]MBB5147630.1 hypothetical protein [Ureibacillus thermosphaericus]NKZ30565.1 YIP1 family protein [Ureibacillus thermosphaericus]